MLSHLFLFLVHLRNYLNEMEAIKNKVFKKGIFPKDTWVYIKSSYNNVIIHLSEDSNFQFYHYDIGYDLKNHKLLERDGCILLSAVDEMEDYSFIIRKATKNEIEKFEKLSKTP